MIVFPSSPSTGQSYVAPNGITYIYDGVKWVGQGGSGGGGGGGASGISGWSGAQGISGYSGYSGAAGGAGGGGLSVIYSGNHAVFGGPGGAVTIHVPWTSISTGGVPRAISMDFDYWVFYDGSASGLFEITGHGPGKDGSAPGFYAVTVTNYGSWWPNIITLTFYN